MRWMIWIGVFGLVLVGFGILLPQLLSVQMVQQSVVNLINQRIAPGALSVERWRLSWRGPMLMQGVSYEDSNQGVLLETVEIATSKGLAALLFKAEDAGELRVVSPVVRLDAHQMAVKRDGTDESTASGAGKVTQAQASTENASPETLGTTGAIPFYGRVIIEDGRVIATGLSDGRPDLLLAQKIDLEAALQPGQASPFSFAAVAPGDQGNIEGTGSITMSAGKSRVANVVLDSKWQLKAWPIDAVLQVAAMVGDAPSGTGVVSGNWQLSAHPEAGLGVIGDIEAREVTLSGGPFQNDKPEFGSLQCRFDLNHKRSGIAFRHLDITTAMVQLKSTGSFGDVQGGQGSFDVTGRVVLPELFAQLPKTLRLKPGMRISSGELTLDANARLAGETTRFEVTGAMKALKGSINGGSVALDSPVTAVARGARSAKGFDIEQLRLQSSFAEVEGGGTRQRFNLSGTADVAQLLHEAGKFFELDGWAGRGQMALTMRIEPQEQGRRLSSSAHITGFALNKGKQPILDGQDFDAEVEAGITPEGSTGPVLNALVLSYQGGIGAGQARAEQVALPGGNSPLAIKGLTHKGRLNLAVLSRALHALGAASGLPNLTGSADLDLTLDAQAQQFGPFEARINIERLGGSWSGKRFADPKVQIKARGAVDADSEEMTLALLEIDSSAGKVRFDKFTASNWNSERSTVASSGKADIDLPVLQQQFGALLGLPATAAIGGKADLSWKAAFRSQGFAEVSLAAEAFSWKQDQTMLFDEPSLTATIKLNGDLPGGDVEIGALEIDSDVLKLNATGSYATTESVPRLSLNGNISARLEKLSESLTQALKTEVVAQEAGGPFQISIAAADGKWAEAWKTMVFDAALAIERIAGYGISLEQLEIPIQVGRGLASAQIAGSVNQGAVRLNPTANLTASPAAVTFPENSVVLKSVVLTQEMLNDLLAEIHPLFKGAVVGQGNIDLNFNHFYWPLEQVLRGQAGFKGKLRFNDTYLASSPLLDLLLALVKSDGRQLNLSGQELTFALRQGRIHSDPVTVTVKSNPVTLVGSMGLDNSLDYTASVPITVDLVGKAAYPLLKDAIFEVPITGTVSKPRIDMKAFKAELKSLTSQAGQQLIQEKAGDWLKKLLD